MVKAPTNTTMPTSDPTTSTTMYFGETRSQPVSAGAAGSTAVVASPPLASSRISGMHVPFLLGLGLVGGKGAERLGDEASGEKEAGPDGRGERDPDRLGGRHHASRQEEHRDAEAEPEHERTAQAARL